MRCPVKACLSSTSFAWRQEALVGHLAGRFAPAVGNVELRDGGYAIGALSEGVAGLREAETQGADDTGGHDGHAGWMTCFAQSVKTLDTPF